MEPNAQSGPKSRLKEQLDNLTEREQMLLKVMLGVFALLALSVVIFLAQQATVELEERTARYQTALDLIATEGPSFVEQEVDDDDGDFTHADLFTDEVLQDNPVQLRGEVAAHAEAVGVSVSSYDTDEQPLGGNGFGDDDNGGPLVIERQLQIDVRNAEMDRLVEMLHRIEESRDPMVITRIDMRSVRDDGHVRALVSVATYEYGDDEES